MSKWNKTVKLAKADFTLVALVASIVAANKSGSPDRIAYGAFRDRVEELGLSVPNSAYYGILLSSLAPKA